MNEWLLVGVVARASVVLSRLLVSAELLRWLGLHEEEGQNQREARHPAGM